MKNVFGAIINFFVYIYENKEWLFSGIGLLVLSLVIGIIKHYITSKNKNLNIVDYENKTDKDSLSYDNNNENDGNNDSYKNNSHDNTVDNKGINKTSFFSKRFYFLMNTLNENRQFSEKEYTIEYINHLIGESDVNILKKYIDTNEEPLDEYKLKFVETFGLNKDWMLYGAGDAPFLQNVRLISNDPEKIMGFVNLSEIDKLILVLSYKFGKRYGVLIQVKNEFCYKVVPVEFGLNSDVGGTGMSDLFKMHKLLYDFRARNKLDNNNVYVADEEWFDQLVNGKIYPKNVHKLKNRDYYFVRNFVDLDDNFPCDEDMKKVKNIINNYKNIKKKQI